VTWFQNVVPEMNMLNDAKIRATRARSKPYKLTDSHRLYLLVKPGGFKLWSYAQGSRSFDI
jgi:hypothetical protein